MHSRSPARGLSAAILLATAASMHAIAYAAPAAAAEAQPQPNVLRSFDIPAQPLGLALIEYSRQANILVVAPQELVHGKTSPTISGSMTAGAALERLLANSGLGYTRSADNRIVVRLSRADAGDHFYHSNGEDPAPGEFEAGQDPAASASVERDDREIVVTGTIIRGATPSGANLIVLERGDLENTGRGSLAEAIQTSPQIHGGGINDATMRSGRGAGSLTGSSGSFGASSVNLRGLGVEETLTLVNGRRLAPSGFYGSFADISAIPFAAVKRVEILADGASATYGADAMAGVVNIILDNQFKGAETRVRAGVETRSGQPEYQASQLFGWSFDRGNILVAGEYAKRHKITPEGRPYAASADLRPFGGSDHREGYCSPGNIISPAALAGAIPADQDGLGVTPDRILRGQKNLCDPRQGADLTPRTERGSLFLASSFEVSDRLRVSGEVIASKRTTDAATGYERLSLTVPVTNAYRKLNGLAGPDGPLSQSIRVDYLSTDAGARTFTTDAWSASANIGAEYSLNPDWTISLAGAYGRHRSKTSSLLLDQRGALMLALASSDPASAFNPFGSGSANSPSVIAGLFAPNRSIEESRFASATATISGSPIQLPGGAVKIALGGDYRYENFGSFELTSYASGDRWSRTQGGRNIISGYAEILIPLVSHRNASAMIQKLSLSASGRYDRYSDFGDTWNPKLGATWVPVAGLTLRGTIGSSFKAPLLGSLHGDTNLVIIPRLQAATSAGDVDGDGFVNSIILSGGNPDLEPEKGRSWTAGVEISPVAVPRLRLHATYFNLKFRDRFGSGALPHLVFADLAAYQNIVYFRSPSQSTVDQLIAAADSVVGSIPEPGSIEAIIDGRTVNIATQLIDGLDTGASYTWDTLNGMLTLAANASYLARYKSRLGQSAAEAKLLSNVGMPPHWQARGGLTWSGSGVSVGGHVNYTGSYMNRVITPNERVSPYTTVDLRVSADIGGRLGGTVGSGMSIALDVTNLFDTAPPFVNNPEGVGYDGANADPIGRRVAVQLTKKW